MPVFFAARGVCCFEREDRKGEFCVVRGHGCCSKGFLNAKRMNVFFVSKKCAGVLCVSFDKKFLFCFTSSGARAREGSGRRARKQ